MPNKEDICWKEDTGSSFCSPPPWKEWSRKLHTWFSEQSLQVSISPPGTVDLGQTISLSRGLSCAVWNDYNSSGLYPLNAAATPLPSSSENQNVSRHYPLSPGEQNCPQSRTTALGLERSAIELNFWSTTVRENFLHSEPLSWTLTLHDIYFPPHFQQKDSTI